MWSENGAGSQERCRELPATSSSESSCSSSGSVKEAAMDWSAAIAVWSCSRTGNNDDVFYLFLQKQKIGAELHVYLEEGTYHKRLFRGPNPNDMKK